MCVRVYTQWNTNQPLKNKFCYLQQYGWTQKVMLSEVREIQIPYDVMSMWNLKCGTNETIYETEKESRTQRTTGDCQGGWGGSGMDS